MGEDEGWKALTEIMPSFTVCNLQPLPSQHQETAQQHGKSRPCAKVKGRKGQGLNCLGSFLSYWIAGGPTRRRFNKAFWQLGPSRRWGGGFLSSYMFLVLVLLFVKTWKVQDWLLLKLTIAYHAKDRISDMVLNSVQPVLKKIQIRTNFKRPPIQGASFNISGAWCHISL